MPAYDRPIQFHLDKPAPAIKAGAVIVFKDNADVARIQRFLDSLAERDIIEPTTVQTYNSNHGTPVWYIP